MTPDHLKPADREAIERVQRAIRNIETDTLGMAAGDKRVLFYGQGSWNIGQPVTVGDVKALLRLVALSPEAERVEIPETYAAFQQRRGRLPDLIDECVEHYDGFMKDDHYDAWGCLRHIVERLRSAKEWYSKPREADRPARHTGWTEKGHAWLDAGSPSFPTPATPPEQQAVKEGAYWQDQGFWSATPAEQPDQHTAYYADVATDQRAGDVEAEWLRGDWYEKWQDATENADEGLMATLEALRGRVERTILAALHASQENHGVDGEVERLREAITLALQCTPSIDHGKGGLPPTIRYDCGDPWHILRAALGKEGA